jgi:L-arabonate dehydrase
LALVVDSDLITLNVKERKLHVNISDVEMERRKSLWVKPKRAADRGYTRLYVDHVNQADEGADLDFLGGSSGSEPPRGQH